DERAFRAKYPLANIRLEGNKSFMSDAFAGGSLFQPQLGSAADEQYLFWRVDERPVTLLTWEDPQTKEVVPATRQVVLEKYREFYARGPALEQAQELARKIGREAQKFPIQEVQRLFRLDMYESTPTPAELTPNDRKSLSFAGSDVSP